MTMRLMCVPPMAALLMVLSAAAIGESQAVDDLAHFRDCEDVCPEMVAIPAGMFDMGSRDDDPEHPPTEPLGPAPLMALTS